MIPAIAEVMNAQTWGAPIFEERPAPAGSCVPYANYFLDGGLINCSVGNGAYYLANVGSICFSAGGAYFVNGSANTVAVLTEAPLIEGRPPVTIAEALPIQSPGASQLDRTIAALNQYRVSAGESSQNPASDALRFLDALPKYLPSPKAAQSETGVVTLFWHEDNFYADAEFHGDGKFSAFTRERVGGETRDEALDEESIENARGAWLDLLMAPIRPRSLNAAA